MSRKTWYLLFSVIASFAVAITTCSADVLVHGQVINGFGNSVPSAEIRFISPVAQDTTVVFTDGDGMYSVMLSATTVEVAESLRPAKPTLHQNHPNPFNPVTTLSFELYRPSHVTLTVFNILGQPVRTLGNDYFDSGLHYRLFDGHDDNGNALAAGIYLYRLRAGAYTETRRMLLLDGGGSSGKTSNAFFLC